MDWVWSNLPQIWAYTPIPAEVNSILQGRRTTCGTFLVVYSPPQA